MLNLSAKIRINLGKSASRNLRLNNKIPANIYGKDKACLAISINLNIILNIKNIKNLYNKNINIKIDNKIYKVKVYDVQYNPFNNKLSHIDFIYI